MNLTQVRQKAKCSSYSYLFPSSSRPCEGAFLLRISYEETGLDSLSKQLQRQSWERILAVSCRDVCPLPTLPSRVAPCCPFLHHLPALPSSVSLLLGHCETGWFLRVLYSHIPKANSLVFSKIVSKVPGINWGLITPRWFSH